MDDFAGDVLSLTTKGDRGLQVDCEPPAFQTMKGEREKSSRHGKERRKHCLAQLGWSGGSEEKSWGSRLEMEVKVKPEMGSCILSPEEQSAGERHDCI